MKSVYLAGRYEWREDLRTIANALQERGVIVTSTWLWRPEPKLPDEWLTGIEAAEIAERDLSDIDAAEWLILFTQNPNTGSTDPGRRAGRFVEMGYGIGKRKHVIVVGPAANVFCSIIKTNSNLSIRRFENWPEFLEYMGKTRRWTS